MTEFAELAESPSLEATRSRIAARFGLVPSFFMMARAEPPIVAAMFGLVEFAYFDSPLPTRLKERLFTYVSRFCLVPYCMARHCAFLVGCGNVAGHPDVEGISVDEAVALLRTPFPNAHRRDQLLAHLQSVPGELDEWPDPTSDVPFDTTSELANTIFFAAAVAFVMPQEHRPLLAELARVLGDRRYQYLMLFLGFIRFAHFWTESHPELHIEDDVDNLLTQQRALADWVRSYPPHVEKEIADTKAELHERALLRERMEETERDVVTLRGELVARTQAAERAEEDSRTKAAFMATLSHELRTPLNAVIGYTGLLETGLGGPLDDRAKFYVARIKATARHQQQIIDEILTFARLDAGRETVRSVLVSLPEIADEICAVITPLAEARGLAFAANFGGAPATFATDPGKLRQVLLNLLGNAVKFTQVGGVTLSVNSSQAALTFVVADTGPGIRSADRERIFEPFTQLEMQDRKNEGTGLGLAITKRLVGLMDGEIRVNDVDGGGSAFVVSFPYSQGASAASS